MAVVKVNIKDLMELVPDTDEDELIEALERIGAPVDEREEDILYVEVTPDRPDYLCTEGLAWSLREFFGRGNPKIRAEDSEWRIIIKDAKARPYIASVVAEGISFSDEGIQSLMQFQEKIHETFGRKRRKIAIGVHDASKIRGRELIYRDGKGDERFVPLGEERVMSLKETLSDTEKGREFSALVKDRYPLIEDEDGIISYPPILNSDRTKVTEETKDFFVEITGTDREAVENVARIVSMLFAVRGARLFKVKIVYPEGEVQTPDLTPKEIDVSSTFINKLLGLDLSTEHQTSLLAKLGLEAKVDGDILKVKYPSWRVDIMNGSDIAEEVAIAYGLNNMEPQRPDFYTIGRDGVDRRIRALTDYMVAAGFNEVDTFVLTNERMAFDLLGLPREDYVSLANPLTENYTMVRPHMTTFILEAVRVNKMRPLPLRVFEVGEVCNGKGETHRHLVVAIYGRVGYDDISGLFKGLCDYMGVEMGLRAEDLPFMIPGRSAIIEKDGKEMGWMGEIHPRVLQDLGLEYPVVLLEVSLQYF